MKTQAVALVMCLNVGVTPPDVIQIDPAARLECWIDPSSLPPRESLKKIGNAIQKQYLRWQGKTKYKQGLDPTAEDIRTLCTTQRRHAKDGHVLFHYNGHGVPRPTTSGEMWVFNSKYTQYIPLSMYDLQSWLASQSIYVFDCSGAGLLVDALLRFGKQRMRDEARAAASSSSASGSAGASAATPPTTPSSSRRSSRRSKSRRSSSSNSSSSRSGRNRAPPPFNMDDTLILAACSADETLPQNPTLPADIFTACLTTPIKMALRFYASSHPTLSPAVTIDMVDALPGRLSDRRTPLGELNWIFTAVTDSIAWNVLPRALFQKLFRQDLLVASLFRNFLLAERILRASSCTPVSVPELPLTHTHPLWDAWDLAVDVALAQLPRLLHPNPPSPPPKYKPSLFFVEQLQAFEVWLGLGSVGSEPPEQLPIVLQVLLSQSHRLRALQLLARFVDMDPWAVNLALAVGIFPYVLKLLQSPAADLRPVLVFIWAKILAVDPSCQKDLVKNNVYSYFINALNTSQSEQDTTMALFVLASIVRNFPAGREACLSAGLLPAVLTYLDPMTQSPTVLAWAATTLGNLGVPPPDQLPVLLGHDDPVVRAAATYALGSVFHHHATSSSSSSSSAAAAAASDLSTTNTSGIAFQLLQVTGDASQLVRRELIHAFAGYISFNTPAVIVAASTFYQEEMGRAPPSPLADPPAASTAGAAGAAGAMTATAGATTVGDTAATESTPHVTHPTDDPNAVVCATVWSMLVGLAVDPYPYVRRVARLLLESIAQSVDGLLDLVRPPTLPSELQRHSQGPTHPSPSSSPSAADTSSKSSKSSKSSPSSSETKPLPPPSTSSPLPSTRDDLPGALKRTSVLNLSHTSSSPTSSTPPASSSSPPPPPGLDVDGLESKFFEWLRRSMCKRKDETDVTLHDGQRLWRADRNAAMDEQGVLESRHGAKAKLEDQVGILASENHIPMMLLFDPYEPHLVVADEESSITVWNWQTGSVISQFTNDNVVGSRMSSMTLVNERDVSMLLVGTDEGIVRLWRNIGPGKKAPSLVTSWRALNEQVPGKRGAGLVTAWQQSSGYLFCSGDCSFVRVWSMRTEQAVLDIPTGSETCVTSLTSDGSSTLVGGTGDGRVLLFDLRAPAREALVKTWGGHSSWILNLAMQSDASSSSIISGSSGGKLKTWDLRADAPVLTVKAFEKGMTAFAVHPTASIMAAGSQNQSAKVFNTDGKELSKICFYDGFLGQRIGPVSSLAFHPNRLYLGVGSTDSIASIYASETYR